ncbi:MAG: ATP phosphoribosyltransferase regulatory subunit [Clostridia bacterium]|nr:ATP phosphoribosyltransferase regulatory subunit [Clostridia bacterium]
MSQTELKEEERVAFALRSLYRSYGYLPYKMNKFEAYDLYAFNKDFLVGDGVITFNDTDGKLLALKPDVTLSIIKNTTDESEKKVYYHENVYRISGETKQFKEIPQIGLERIGEVDAYVVYETITLALKSLLAISKDVALDISHLGVLSAVLDEVGAGDAFNKKARRLIADKNAHELKNLCAEYNVADDKVQMLIAVARAYGKPEKVLPVLQSFGLSKQGQSALADLQVVCTLLQNSEYADKINLDFSAQNDMKYYNGFVFKGFVAGVCEGVLSGGQYDKLMERMGRKSGAIGFAVYLDLLEHLKKNDSEYDLDALVLYDDKTPVQDLIATVQGAVERGEKVSAQKTLGKVRAKRVIDLTGGKTV